MVQILTHPNNKHNLEKLQVEQALNRYGYHPIRTLGIPIVYSELVPETTPSKTDFLDAEKNKFCSYSTTNPKDWEVYFGFVKPIPIPNFVMMDDHKTTVTHEVWRDLECSSNSPTIPFVKDQKIRIRPSVSSPTQRVHQRQLQQSRASILMPGTS